MSSKRWSAACTVVQARASAQKSPDFAPTLRDSVFADARSGAVCVVANPRNSTAIAAVLRAGGRPLAAHPAKPLSRREEIVNTFYARGRLAFATVVMKARCPITALRVLPALLCAMQAFFHPCNLVDAALRKF